jgi:hypothetical protein
MLQLRLHTTPHYNYSYILHHVIITVTYYTTLQLQLHTTPCYNYGYILHHIIITVTYYTTLQLQLHTTPRYNYSYILHHVTITVTYYTTLQLQLHTTPRYNSESCWYFMLYNLDNWERESLNNLKKKLMERRRERISLLVTVCAILQF